MAELVRIVVHVPVGFADGVRSALAEAGAGVVGGYSGCSFTIRGTGRFTPGAGTSPFQGDVGVEETVDEEQIEVVCERSRARSAVEAVFRVHPYEEPHIVVQPVLDIAALS